MDARSHYQLKVFLLVLAGQYNRRILFNCVQREVNLNMLLDKKKIAFDT